MYKIPRRVLSLICILCLCLSLAGCGGIKIVIQDDSDNNQQEQENNQENVDNNQEDNQDNIDNNIDYIDPEHIPAYSGEAYIALCGNTPLFDESEYTTESFETYSDLDSLGRCGVAYANIGPDLMPTESRGSIGQVKPSGWQSTKYDNIDGKYLYNRCHLIGYQLTAENANRLNLITGTRYLNVTGMLPFENLTADYIKETGNHVLYRVTPIFDGDNLIADGVQMEARSIEDDGEGVLFHVFCYNVQPGIIIDYATGESRLESDQDSQDKQEQDNLDKQDKQDNSKTQDNQENQDNTESYIF